MTIIALFKQGAFFSKAVLPDDHVACVAAMGRAVPFPFPPLSPSLSLPLPSLGPLQAQAYDK